MYVLTAYETAGWRPLATAKIIELWNVAVFSS